MSIQRVITQYERELSDMDKVLVDLDDMVTTIRDDAPYSDADMAMVALVHSIETKVVAEQDRLVSKIAGLYWRKTFIYEVEA